MSQLFKKLRVNQEIVSSIKNGGRGLLSFSKDQQSKKKGMIILLIAALSIGTFAALSSFRLDNSSNSSVSHDPSDLAPTDDLEVFNKAVLLYKSKNYNEALIHFLRLSDQHPEQYALLSNIALIYKQQGDHTNAKEFYLKALSHNENDPTLHNNIALLYLDMNVLDKSHHHFERSIELNPNNPVTRINASRLYEKMKDWKGAASEYRVAQASPHLGPSIAQALPYRLRILQSLMETQGFEGAE